MMMGIVQTAVVDDLDNIADAALMQLWRWTSQRAVSQEDCAIFTGLSANDQLPS